MQHDFLDKELLSDFSVTRELPFALAKQEASLILVNDILFRGDNRILFVVDRIDLLHFYGKIFSHVCNSVGVVYGEAQVYHKDITILSSSSFQSRSSRLSGYDSIIFESFSRSRINLLIMERFKEAAIAGMTDTLIGYSGRVQSNKMPTQINENNMKLLEKLNRIFKRTTLKDVFLEFEIDFTKKELLWFKGNKSLSIRVSKQERFVFFEDLHFKAAKLVSVDSVLVRVFGSTSLKFEIINDIKTRAGAYEYVLKAANGSSSIEEMFALRSKILNPSAYLKANKHQLDRISFLMQQLGKDYSNIKIPEVEITSQVAVVLIAGLEEKRFRTTAMFGKLKKMFIQENKTIKNIKSLPEEEYQDIKTNKAREIKNMSERVTLEELKDTANEKLTNKLLDLSIELIQQEDSNSRKLTLELLKYLKTK